MATNIKSEREERIEKINKLRGQGIDPYPAKAERTHKIAEILENFEKLKTAEKKVTVAGRLRGKRAHGNLSFANLEDDSGSIQIAFSKQGINAAPAAAEAAAGKHADEKGIDAAAANAAHADEKYVSAENYKNFVKLIDVGDFLQVSGLCFTTQKGENSLHAESYKLLAKAIRPLPDKWHGLKDAEEKLRKRYLDIIFNPEAKELIRKRAEFWNSTREFLRSKGFIEVETPALETAAGGADARPFITHHNALDMDVFLRISMGELWQKRLMVAGLEKTFEIGRQFRNEGMDAEHLQDYTQMEFYWAYADYKAGMEMVEKMYQYIAGQTFGTLKFQINKHKVDLGKKWEIYDYRDTVKKITGVDILGCNIGQIENKLKELGVDYDKKGWNITRAIDNLWKYCRRRISGPGFLAGVPLSVSPLAKKMAERPELTQRFQVIIAGSELGNGYSELNDPLDQAERFSEQQKLRDAGDDEAQMHDHDFVEALEYGMPPTCGFGMSERVFAFFMDKPARECQIFPLVKPKKTE